jgi:hypothetical protein
LEELTSNKDMSHKVITIAAKIILMLGVARGNVEDLIVALRLVDEQARLGHNMDLTHELQYLSTLGA